MSQTTIVYILGNGHSGSTLLNLMLNKHSEIISMGEIAMLHKYIPNIEEPESHELNEKNIKSISEFWGSVIGTLSQKGLEKPDINISNNLMKNDLEKWSRNNQLFFETISEVGRVNLIVDASKNWQRCLKLCEGGFCDLKIIHLQRDLRAVCYSYLKRRVLHRGEQTIVKQSSLLDTFRILWKNQIGFYLIRSRFNHNLITINYEELIDSTSSVMLQLSNFLGIIHTPEMESPNDGIYFGKGGNRLRFKKSHKLSVDHSWVKELGLGKRIALFWGGISFLNFLRGYGVRL